MIGPEHAWLHDQRRAEYVAASDARSAGGRAPALAHRRHHSGARIGARGGRSRAARARGHGPRSSSSTSPAAATRTSTSTAKTCRSSTRHDAHRHACSSDLRKRDGRKGLIAYLTAGDPVARAHARAGGGAGARRRGPDRAGRAVFRSHRRWPGDPARRRARAEGRHHAAPACWKSRAEIRERSEVPLLLFTYLNPVLRYGLERLARDAAARGHRRLPAHRRLGGRGARIRRRHARARPRHGVSGRAHQHAAAPEAGGAVLHRLRLPGFAHRRHRRARLAFRAPSAPLVRAVRAVTDLPLAVGFGISTPEHVAELGEAGGGGGGGQRVRAPDRAEWRQRVARNPARILRARAEARACGRQA